MLARWTQRDPLDQPSDLGNANPYAYVGGDPVNSIDPLGTVDVCAGIPVAKAFCKIADEIKGAPEKINTVKDITCEAQSAAGAGTGAGILVQAVRGATAFIQRATVGGAAVSVVCGASDAVSIVNRILG